MYFPFKLDFSSGDNAFYVPVFLVCAIVRMAAFVFLRCHMQEPWPFILGQLECAVQGCECHSFWGFGHYHWANGGLPTSIGFAWPMTLHTGCSIAGLVTEFFPVLQFCVIVKCFTVNWPLLSRYYSVAWSPLLQLIHTYSSVARNEKLAQTCST